MKQTNEPQLQTHQFHITHWQISACFEAKFLYKKSIKFTIIYLIERIEYWNAQNDSSTIEMKCGKKEWQQQQQQQEMVKYRVTPLRVCFGISKLVQKSIFNMDLCTTNSNDMQ